MAETGHPETGNDVRGDGSFPRKQSPDAGDGCTAGHCQPGLLLVAIQLRTLVPASATGQFRPHAAQH